MTITILGLGPGNPAHLTLEARRVLEEADEVYLRTKRHPTVASLPSHLSLHSFDHLYEEKADFAQVYEELAARVLALGERSQGVIYAVPGHPLVGEASVQRILALAQERGLDVRIVEGLSFVEPVLTCLALDAMEGLQLVDATELASLHHPPVNPDRPTLVGQLYGRHLASSVKLTLMNLFPADHQVVLVRGAGTAGEKATALPLYELDRNDNNEQIDHLTTLYLPPLPQTSSLESFQDTIAHLRAPDGCPWDREQTHQSLRAALLEETYEVLTALDADDMDALCEELGDLLLQILLHAQIAVEESDFSLAQVLEKINAKIKRRHPHVFGDVTVNGTAEVLHNWEEIKREEKGEAEGSMLDDVPPTLPALAQAQSYQRRVARVGFDWPDVEGVVDKVAEEVEELLRTSDAAEREEELGDLLFSLVNLARWLKVEAESALRAANARFAQRFAAMEDLCRQRGQHLADLSLAEQDALWEEVKNR
jgi:tetrapyrrole methylase family protein/MazG family protein